MARIALLLTFLGSVTVASAQVPAEPAGPAFEVASVHWNFSGEKEYLVRMPAQGIVSLTNVTLRALIREAYNIDPSSERFTLIAGMDDMRPGKIADPTMSARFDIQGKPPDGAPAGQQRLMLRALLAERFKLRVHAEERLLPNFFLSVAREGELGEYLRPGSECYSCISDPIQSGTAAISGWNRTFRGAGTMDALARQLQAHADRPVINETGLPGIFSWVVAFRVRDGSEHPDNYDLSGAVQIQLRLKMEPRLVRSEVLVVDSVELPASD